MFYNHNCYRLILYLNDLSANYLLLYPVYPIPLLFTLTVPQLAAFIKHFPTNERLRTLFLSLFSCCFYMWMTPCLVSYLMKQSALWTLLHCPLTLLMGSARSGWFLFLFFTVIIFFFSVYFEFHLPLIYSSSFILFRPSSTFGRIIYWFETFLFYYRTFSAVKFSESIFLTVSHKFWYIMFSFSFSL